MLRLVDGFDDGSGRVEVFYLGKWGTVCGDGWNSKAAEIACRQLGFHETIAMPGNLHTEFSAVGKGTIWLDNVKCVGNEDTLLECEHGKMGKTDCYHQEDAGLLCSPRHEEGKDLFQITFIQENNRIFCYQRKSRVMIFCTTFYQSL